MNLVEYKRALSAGTVYVYANACGNRQEEDNLFLVFEPLEEFAYERAEEVYWDDQGGITEYDLEIAMSHWRPETLEEHEKTLVRQGFAFAVGFMQKMQEFNNG